MHALIRWSLACAVVLALAVSVPVRAAGPALAADESIGAKNMFYLPTHDASFSDSSPVPPPVAAAPQPSPPTQVASTPPVAPKKPAGKKKTPDYFGLKVQLVKVSPDGGKQAVSMKHQFTSGDRFRLIVTPNRSSYVYVYNQYIVASANDVKPERLIYPRPGAGPVQLKANQSVFLPGENKTFKLDANQSGTERMKLVLSAEPLPTPAGGSEPMMASLNPVPEGAKWVDMDETPILATATPSAQPTVQPALYVVTAAANMTAGQGARAGHLVHQFDLVRR